MIKLLEYCSISKSSDVRVADHAGNMRTAMFKLKQVLFTAAVIGGFALITTASILARVSVQEGVAVEPQIDILDTMSHARELPLQTVDGAI